MSKLTKYTSLLLMYLLFSTLAHAEPPTQKYCDSLIESGIKKMRAGKYLESLEILTQSHAIAEKKNWPKQLFLSKNYMGGNYFFVLDYGEALTYFMAAYTIAINKLEPKYEMMALNNIAGLYTKIGKLKKAKGYFTKAYNLSLKEKDSSQIAIYAFNLGVLANSTNDLTKARIHFDEALKYLKPDSQLVLDINCGIAENELKKKHSENAIALAQKNLSNFKEWHGNNTVISLLLITAEGYIQLRHFEKAIEYTQLANKNNTNLETKKTIFEFMANINVLNQKLPEALHYKDSIITIKDTLEELANGRVFENNRVKFEMQEYKNQISLNETTISNERKIFYTILAAVVFALVLIILILRNLSTKHKNKKLIAENNEQIAKLELEKKKSDNLLLEKQFEEEQTNALLEQERLKSEIEYKNRKLSVNALYLSRKNENIEEMLRLLSNLPDAAKDQSVKNHINFLKKDMRTDNEWESFIAHFEEVNQGFLARLKAKHTDLTVNDIRFICYVFMNLSSKEIASMLSITLDACRKRKERVSTKLGLPDSGNLYSYLSAI